jgi:hypothetical protein
MPAKGKSEETLMKNRLKNIFSDFCKQSNNFVNLLIVNCPLPITHYPLPITHYPLPITNYNE